MCARPSLLLIALLPAFATPGYADRTYRLVDYPANQNGHFLNGTITTTDDAPDDALLDVAEILSWQWSISGANTFAASSLDYLLDNTTTTNVLISSATISLPFADGSPPGLGRLQLGRRLDLGARGVNQHRIDWGTGGRHPSSSAYRQQGDAFQSFWGDFVSLPSSSSWIIAIAVPEPGSALLLTACALACALRRSTPRALFE